MKNWAILSLFSFSILLGCNAPQKKINNELPKIMSTNACTDQLLIYLAQPEQILSLSHYSKDKISSSFANIAKKYPSNYGSPEEILKYNPDIILTSNYERDGTINAIKMLNIKSEAFSVPNNLDDAKEQIIRAGDLLNQKAKAQKLILKIDEAAKQSQYKPIRTLVYFSGGYSAGKNTLLDQILTRAGMINAAPDYGIGNWGHIDIERLIIDPPQILIIADKHTNGAFAERDLRHPILNSKLKNTKIANFPNQYAYCGGAIIPDLAIHLKKIRHEYEFK